MLVHYGGERGGERGYAVAGVLGDRGFLAAVACAMIVVQGLDAFVGAHSHNRIKTIGPAVTALANAAALGWLFAS